MSLSIDVAQDREPAERPNGEASNAPRSQVECFRRCPAPGRHDGGVYELNANHVHI